MRDELKSAASAKIGKKFAEKRKYLGYSLDQVSEILVINKDYLKAIEGGNYSIFPSESFAKAYFLKYRDFLKISNEFPNIFDFKTSKNKMKIQQETNFNEKIDLFSILIYVCLIISLVTGVYLFIQFPDFIGQKKINGEIEIKNIQNVINEPDNQNNTEILYSVDQEKISSNKLTIDDNLLKLEFSGECWIEIYVDEKIVEAQLFKADDIYKTEIVMPFKVIVGNADYVNGTYNGDVIDFITDANRLTRVSTINYTDE